MKIVVLDAGTMRLPESDWNPLGELGTIELFENTPREADAVIERCSDADVVICNKVPMGRKVLENMKSKTLIALLATGTNNVDLESARAQNITVCNVPSYSTAAVAQHTFSLLFELTNKTGIYANSVARGDWIRSEHFSYWNHDIPELDGKTLGVIGFGDIGRRVAAIGHALGMKIMASMRNPREAPDWEGFQFASNEAVFAQADVVTLHCPQTSENKGMVNAALLRTMKPSAYLINTGRGGLIVEEDLVHALNEGYIAGAALDVIDGEPMRKECPLLGASNLIITPHLAWASLEARRRLLDQTVQNLQAFQQGQPINVVNG